MLFFVKIVAHNLIEEWVLTPKVGVHELNSSTFMLSYFLNWKKKKEWLC